MIGDAVNTAEEFAQLELKLEAADWAWTVRRPRRVSVAPADG